MIFMARLCISQQKKVAYFCVFFDYVSLFRRFLSSVEKKKPFNDDYEQEKEEKVNKQHMMRKMMRMSGKRKNKMKQRLKQKLFTMLVASKSESFTKIFKLRYFQVEFISC